MKPFVSLIPITFIQLFFVFPLQSTKCKIAVLLYTTKEIIMNALQDRNKPMKNQT